MFTPDTRTTTTEIETPFHRQGNRISARRDFEAALREGGVDYRVEKKPAYYRREDHEKDGERLFSRAQGSFLIVRQDTHTPLGHVGSVYSPLQNRDAFRVVVPLLEKGIAEIESAGTMRGGRDAYLMIAFDREGIFRRIHENGFGDVDFDALEDLLGEIAPHGLVTNNHDGSRMVTLKELAVRLVCSNGLVISDDQNVVKVKHTGDVEENVRAASASIFGGYVERLIAFAGDRQVLRRTRLSEDAFDRLVIDPVVPYRHLEKKIQSGDATSRTESALERALDRRDSIRVLWDQGEGHEAARNAWEAYNALVEWTDHSDDAIGGDDQRRVRSLYDGKLDRVKHETLNRLVTFATADEEGREALLEA